MHKYHFNYFPNCQNKTKQIEQISYEIAERRPKNVAVCYADPSKAKKELNWEAEYDINKMCKDSWYWQNKNPK